MHKEEVILCGCLVEKIENVACEGGVAEVADRVWRADALIKAQEDIIKVRVPPPGARLKKRRRSCARGLKDLGERVREVVAWQVAKAQVAEKRK